MEYKHSVILHPNIDPREIEFLSMFCYKITSPSKLADLLEFRCTKINVSHHNYIEIETLGPKDQAPFALCIPHYMVLLISGSEDRTFVGYAL